MAEVIYRSIKKAQMLCVFNTSKGVQTTLKSERFPNGFLQFENHVLKLDDRWDKPFIESLDKDKRNRGNGGKLFSKDEETKAARNIQMMMAGEESVSKPAGDIPQDLKNTLEELSTIAEFEEEVKDLKKVKTMLKKVFDYFTFEGFSTNIQPLNKKRVTIKISDTLEMLKDHKVWDDDREGDSK